jgi:hypothetical protein
VVGLVYAQNANAKVYFDTDVYGDKELKIATVNKIKQKLRNAILEDVSVAPQLLQLSISDALSYDAQTLAGGPDGSIQFKIKSDGLNADLSKGLAVLQKIKNELKRTNTVSFSDLCAFGGAEALETAGCGRMIVQVGRADAKAGENEAPLLIDWSAPSSNTVQQSFNAAGLDAKQIVVLLGALGELQRVVYETQNAGSAAGDEDDEDFEPQPFVPTTFGSRDAMYGSKMGKGDFGVKFLSSILKGGKSELASILVGDPKFKSLVQKYASNEADFLQDVQQVYLKMTLLGQASTTRNA